MNWTAAAVAAALRLTMVGSLLLVGFPLLLLPRRPAWELDDRLVAAGTVGVFFVMVAGYLLVPMRLFEPLGTALLMVVVVGALVHRREGSGAILRYLRAPLAWAMHHLLDRVRAASHGRAAAKAEQRQRRPMMIAWPAAAFALLLLGVACFVRLSDAFAHAAPAPSIYTTQLQWTKWLTMPDDGLFKDGVVPKGLNLLLAALRFFSREEPHTALRVGGPLLNLAGLGGLWYVVKRAGGGAVAGLVAVGLLLGAPAWLPAEYARSAYPLADEFAMGLLLPAAWFGYRYLTEGDLLDALLVGFCAITIAGTSWTAVPYFGAVVVAAAGTAGLGRLVPRRLALLAGSGAGGIALGLLPIGVALLFGVPLRPGSGGEAVGGVPVTAVAITAFALTLAVMEVRRRPEVLLLPLTAVGFIAIGYLPALGVPLPGVLLTGNSFLAVAVVGAIGAGYGSLERVIGLRRNQWVSAIAGAVVVGAAYLYQPPAPAAMQPVLTDEMTLQALRISASATPATWQVIGRDELLALVLGTGFFNSSSAWLDSQAVPPPDVTIASVLADNAKPRPGRPENTNDLYFFVETRPYIGAAASDQALTEANLKLLDWVTLYGDTHPHAVKTWYRSETLTIYLIRPPGKR